MERFFNQSAVGTFRTKVIKWRKSTHVMGQDKVKKKKYVECHEIKHSKYLNNTAAVKLDPCTWPLTSPFFNAANAILTMITNQKICRTCSVMSKMLYTKYTLQNPTIGCASNRVERIILQGKNHLLS